MKVDFKKIAIKILFIFFVFSFLGIFAGHAHGQVLNKSTWKWWYTLENPTATPPSPKYISIGGPTGAGFNSEPDCKTDLATVKPQDFNILEKCTQYDTGGPDLKIINSNNNQTGPADKWYYQQKQPDKTSKRVNATGYDDQATCKVDQEKDLNALSDCYTPYQTLAPLPLGPGGAPLTEFDPVSTNFVDYLNMFFKLLIGIAGVLAVVMIVIGGIQYMTTDLPFGKGEAKNRIVGAVFGLVLALASWLILYTLNPNILSGVFDIGFQRGTVSTTTNVGSGGVAGQTVTVNGQVLTACDESQTTTVNLMGNTVKVNKAIVDNVKAVNDAWYKQVTVIKNPKIFNYKINSISGYNCRPATGQTTQASGHAYGISIDINPDKNPYSSDPKHCTTNMPPDFIKLFKDNGWGWGGDWNDVKDPMHFSLKPNEVHSNAGCTQ